MGVPSEHLPAFHRRLAVQAQWWTGYCLLHDWPSSAGGTHMSPRSDHFLQSKVLMFARDLVAPVKQERLFFAELNTQSQRYVLGVPWCDFFIFVCFLIFFLSRSITKQRHLIPLQNNITKNPMIPSCQGKDTALLLANIKAHTWFSRISSSLQSRSGDKHRLEHDISDRALSPLRQRWLPVRSLEFRRDQVSRSFSCTRQSSTMQPAILLYLLSASWQN